MFLWNIAVTSLAEVWIEISYACEKSCCGSVTSLAEVWIEISRCDRCHVSHGMSLPLRKCGLKYSRCGYFFRWISHFPCGSVDWNFRWINVLRDIECHFPCGSVDWNFLMLCFLIWIKCHFPCGSVDWNHSIQTAGVLYCRHFPCGSVDWNLWYRNWIVEIQVSLPLRKCGLKYEALSRKLSSDAVTSLAEVWIEIPEAPQHIRIDLRHFPCGSVDWNLKIPLIRHGASCHFPCGSVDWNCSWIRQQKGLRSLPLRKCGLK